MSEQTTNQPTEQEIKEYLKKQEDFYDSNIPLLEKKANYFKLLAEIEMYNLKALEYKLNYASLMYESKKKPEQTDESES